MISPNTSMWINIILAVLGYLLGAGALLTTLFGQGMTQTIVAAAGLAFGILSSINTVLHGVSAPKAGPMLKKGV